MLCNSDTTLNEGQYVWLLLHQLDISAIKLSRISYIVEKKMTGYYGSCHRGNDHIIGRFHKFIEQVVHFMVGLTPSSSLITCALQMGITSPLSSSVDRSLNRFCLYFFPAAYTKETSEAPI